VVLSRPGSLPALAALAPSPQLASQHYCQRQHDSETEWSWGLQWGRPVPGGGRLAAIHRGHALLGVVAGSAHRVDDRGWLGGSPGTA